MPSRHEYRARVEWTGNEGTGTSAYRAYSRDHMISGDGKPSIPGSSSVGARRDEWRYCPDELLVAALSACHMLWYLHLAAEAGVVVRSYVDEAVGELEIGPDGGGHFLSATLRPVVELASGDAGRARALHEEAHRKCFVASSVNFPVRVEPTIREPARAARASSLREARRACPR
jgi:organic hydroperoxide reductase OsmC/OhrA